MQSIYADDIKLRIALKAVVSETRSTKPKCCLRPALQRPLPNSNLTLASASEALSGLEHNLSAIYMEVIVWTLPKSRQLSRLGGKL